MPGSVQCVTTYELEKSLGTKTIWYGGASPELGMEMACPPESGKADPEPVVGYVCACSWKSA